MCQYSHRPASLRAQLAALPPFLPNFPFAIWILPGHGRNIYKGLSPPTPQRISSHFQPRPPQSSTPPHPCQRPRHISCKASHTILVASCSSTAITRLAPTAQTVARIAPSTLFIQTTPHSMSTARPTSITRQPSTHPPIILPRSLPVVPPVRRP